MGTPKSTEIDKRFQSKEWEFGLAGKVVKETQPFPLMKRASVISNEFEDQPMTLQISLIVGDSVLMFSLDQ